MASSLTTQADTDTQVIALWLHGKSPRTQAVYTADIRRFVRFVGKALQQVNLCDVCRYTESLAGLAPAIQARLLAVVKSLFAFAHKRISYLPLDIAAPVKLPAVKNTRAGRILPEEAVHRMLALEATPRNHALLRMLYAAGLRVSEACGLTWNDLHERGDTGQVTVFGKGGKMRVVLLPTATWRAVVALRGDAGGRGPVFPSRKRRGHLTRTQVRRIVRAAARRAGIRTNVSPHWLRHAHASHALDRGAPIHLVQATLGHSSVATTGRYVHARPTDSSSRYLAV